MKPTRIMLALAATLAPMALGAQSTENLQKEIEGLKQQVQALQQKADSAQEKAAETKDLDHRLTRVEKKMGAGNVQWGGDLMTRFDSTQWDLKPYQQFEGFIQNPGNPAMPMPIVQQVGAQVWSNPVQWSTRLRLNMGIHINDHAQIMGRLVMYKIHGGATVPTFNGSPNTINTTFTAGQVPSSDVLRVERASLVYHFPLGILSIGRQNTTDGPPFEIREGQERQATPMAMAVNATIDGMGWKFELSKIGFPDSTLLGICYGVGFESGFGGGGLVKTSAAPVGFNFTNATATNPGAATLQVNTLSHLKDTNVLGIIYDMPLLFAIGDTVQSTHFFVQYDHFNNMTDIPFGNTLDFPVPSAPGMGGMPSTQFVTATNNLGDMDQWTVVWEHQIGDHFSYFLSGGYIKSHPNGKSSQYGAYWGDPSNPIQLSGFGGLMGDPYNSHTATAYYTGVRWDPTEKLGFGLEFNHGSPRWFTYTPATGMPSDKLGARGDVWEGYTQWRFAKNADVRLGYLHYHYTHAFSGWQIAPGPMPGESWEASYNLNNNPMLQYAFPATVKDFYAALTVHF